MLSLRSISILVMCLLCHVGTKYALGFTAPTHQLKIHHTSSLSAKKPTKKKKSNNAGSFKGFGAAPPPEPTFDEYVSKLRTRMPENADNQPCPCGGKSETEKLYGQCCGLLHRGERKALTTTDVLRSRYSAFSWRLIPYIIETTHETCRDYLDDKVKWATSLNRYGMFDSFDFVKLEPGPEEPSTEDENVGFINFNVTLRANDESYLEDHAGNIAPGQETTMTERSKFIRDPSTGVWTYSSGDVRSTVQGLEDVTLNVD